MSTKPEEITYNETLPDATEADAKEVAEDAKKEEKEDQPTGNETSDEIRTEIEETRAELIETIDALQNKLDPNRIKDRAIGATAAKVQELAHSAQDKIGPATEKIGESAKKLSEAVGPAAEKAKEKIPALVEYTQKNVKIMMGVGLSIALIGWSIHQRKKHFLALSRD